MQSSSDQQPGVNVSAYASVDSITRLAEKHGWPSPAAFHIAMMLVITGVEASEAERMFARAERVRQ